MKLKWDLTFWETFWLVVLASAFIYVTMPNVTMLKAPSAAGSAGIASPAGDAAGSGAGTGPN